MQIACPRCDEGYRLDPARFPGRRVRSACLGCGELLYLRVIEGGLAEPAVSTGRSTTAEEVPLWREPGAPAVAEESAEPAPPEPAVPTELGVAGALAEAAAPAPEVPPAIEVESAATRVDDVAARLGGKPLAPFLEPPVAPEEVGPPAASLPKPLAPFLEPPDEADLAAGPGGVRGGFTLARVGDTSARAQRLARALVSDILVYHPKKVEQGLREGNLKDSMKEEVEKSWDEYCERLGPDVARANRSHFVAALNEILARGQPLF